MNNKELVAKCLDIAKNYKTLYVMGCFGAPLVGSNVTRYCQNHSYNKKAERTKMIKAAADQNPVVFGFDCVCLIKGILWGWNGDSSKSYGGAGYAVNGVPDIGADQMITKCAGVSSTGWADMIPGEAVWCSGHIGVYIGDGLAVECTPAWENKVQITAVKNIGSKSGYNARQWTKHGRLPFIIYDEKDVSTSVKKQPEVSGTISTGNASDEKVIWDYLYEKIGNPYGVAGLMGNLYAESALRSNNLQNSYERRLGYTDDSYTEAVDSGKYGKFVRDEAGYGLAQWTYWSRKEALLNYARSKGKSIGDLTMQLGFLCKELKESYKSVFNALKSADTVRDASDAVLTKFERPANMGDAVKAQRAGYGQKYYDKYADAGDIPQKPSEKPTATFSVGETVQFIGNKHYVSSNSVNGKSCKPGTARVTAYFSGGKHPYHLIKVTGGGSDVYGWVDAKDIDVPSKPVKKGSRVKVRNGAKTYNGGTLAAFVYGGVYDVIEVSGDRAVIGKGAVVTAAVKVGDLTVQ